MAVLNFEAMTEPETQAVYEARVRNAYRDEHIREWITAQAPDNEAVQDIDPSLLRGLYPNLWEFGPRGDIYIAQLRGLILLLDSQTPGPAIEDFFEKFDELGKPYTLWNARLFEGALDYGEAEGFLDAPSIPFYMPPLIKTLDTHPLIDDPRLSRQNNFRVSLEFFSQLTLSYGRLCRISNQQVRGLMDLYRKRCIEWGLPH